jgi:type III restriction enzyme
MDKGAHFHCCDFQVHTPRDTNWSGNRPVSDGDRKTYAEKFIAACRAKGLQAVAITDHHDLCFFPFIKEAAATETDDSGKPINVEQRVVVFPGMELTLGVPCQAILILDAAFPSHLLSTLYTVLAVTQNDTQQDRHAPTTRLTDIKTLEQLCDMLDRIDYLKGHYTLLPNVSETGNSTILRSGFAGNYASMPCVGGYLDGSVTQLGNGNRTILEGRNKEYGFKPLGLFQTSDNRQEDFSVLGTHCSWIKWATPTAEALRQACLAKETRISHTKPLLPSLVIENFEVSNCKFLGPINIEFNAQFNCFIGGRGTGKSTFLEYLRWGLCDQPPSFTDEDEGLGYQAKRATLIDKTLIPFQGIVTVGFLLDNVPHVVRRHSHTGDIALKIGKDEFRPCTEDDVRDLLPIQAYSQKQLSAVGVRSDELIRFIRASVKKQLTEFSSNVNGLKAQIRNSYGLLRRKRDVLKEIEHDQLELDSLTKRVEALRGELKGLTPADQKVLQDHDFFLQEEQHVERFSRDLSSLREMTTTFSSTLASMPSTGPKEATLPDIELLDKIEGSLKAIFSKAQAHVKALVALLDDTSPEVAKYETQLAEWKGLFDAHVVQYEEAKQRATSHTSHLKQIKEAEDRIKSLRSIIADKKDKCTKLGTPESDYEKTREEWVGVYKARAELLTQKCNELTALSSQRIRATLRKGAGVQQAKEKMLAIFSGTKVRTKKAEDLFDHISSQSEPISEWIQVVGELERIALIPKIEGAKVELPDTPTLKKTGFSASDIERLATKLNVEEWLDISLAELDDVPVFEYRQREGEYIQFSEASAGQQATALLRVLLNQEGSPLLIDQPEEDLDNQVIRDIVVELWKAKRKRQIIFSSHNANIVVNGDADLVICCDYRTAGDHSGGKIKCQGAIDVEEINREITAVMEGGEEAFRLRKAKYGF